MFGVYVVYQVRWENTLEAGTDRTQHRFVNRADAQYMLLILQQPHGNTLSKMNAAPCHETPGKSSQDFWGTSKGAHNFQSVLQLNNQFPQLIMPTKKAFLCLDSTSLCICESVNSQGLTLEQCSNTALERERGIPVCWNQNDVLKRLTRWKMKIKCTQLPFFFALDHLFNKLFLVPTR